MSFMVHVAMAVAKVAGIFKIAQTSDEWVLHLPRAPQPADRLAATKASD